MNIYSQAVDKVSSRVQMAPGLGGMEKTAHFFAFLLCRCRGNSYLCGRITNLTNL